MRIVEIKPLENGAHRNQTSGLNVCPDGWAIIPDDMETPNFPFGNIVVDDSTPPVVTSWTPGVMPDPTQPEEEPSMWDELDLAYREGVDSI